MDKLILEKIKMLHTVRIAMGNILFNRGMMIQHLPTGPKFLNFAVSVIVRTEKQLKLQI